MNEIFALMAAIVGLVGIGLVATVMSKFFAPKQEQVRNDKSEDRRSSYRVTIDQERE